jgi:hypothetical protein
MEAQGRFEMKFAVPMLLRDELIRRCSDFMMPDPQAHRLDQELSVKNAWGYSVHSLYFDTPALDDYFERLQEMKVRNRIRIRTYGQRGDSSPIFLENKRKLDDRVIKQRVKICNTDQWRLTPGAFPWEPWVAKLKGGKSYAGRHFSWLVRTARRTPVSIVHYIREVYVPRLPTTGRLRFTLDHQVSVTQRPTIADLHAPPDALLIPSDWMVMELKYDRFPTRWMLQLCHELRLISEPISKFGMSVAQTLRSHKPHEVRYLTPRSLRPVLRTLPPYSRTDDDSGPG